MRAALVKRTDPLQSVISGFIEIEAIFVIGFVCGHHIAEALNVTTSQSPLLCPSAAEEPRGATIFVARHLRERLDVDRCVSRRRGDNLGARCRRH